MVRDIERKLRDDAAAKRMGFDNNEHRLAYLGLMFTNVSDNAKSDGCDEYWWRTAGLRAILAEIDKRLGE